MVLGVMSVKEHLVLRVKIEVIKFLINQKNLLS